PDGHVAPPCVMVIFGAAGDLTKRKLNPPLYNLKHNRILFDQFAVLGIAPAKKSYEEIRSRMRDAMKEIANDKADPQEWSWLEERLYYMSGDFDDDAMYAQLKTRVEELDKSHQTQGNYSFYLAVAPQFFAPVVEQLGRVGLTNEENSH